MNCSALLHRLECGDERCDRPLNNPYDYLPHPLVRRAALCVTDHLAGLNQYAEELSEGKMLGVLVVRCSDGEVGYLMAFSGMLGGGSRVEGFVPPIFDLDDSDGYYRCEEARISSLSNMIESLDRDPQYVELRQQYTQLDSQLQARLSTMRADYRRAKELRAEQRQRGVTTADQLAAMQRESQHAKGEIKRFEGQMRGELAALSTRLEKWRSRIDDLKAERAAASQQLQQRMFTSYRVVNGRGEWRSLFEIFDQLLHRLPPAGAGECAAPKLLHYALCNSLTPLAMGEFWYGRSPKGEVRRHGHFYGACRGKCYTILEFVLQGIELEAAVEQPSSATELEILYEDDHLAVVEKPAGMLSVAGRTQSYSVESEVERLFGGLMVHRLDQDTSGVMVVAKSREVHRELQRQFAMRTMVKRYVAIVDGVVESREGEIRLPLSPNFEDRPRQMVDYQSGKAAHTSYRVVSKDGARSRLELYPHTGRTHQLRLHLAHHEGLDAPIVGDRLYGRRDISSRLMLHAEQITLRHPCTGEQLIITSPAPF